MNKRISFLSSAISLFFVIILSSCGGSKNTSTDVISALDEVKNNEAFEDIVEKISKDTGKGFLFTYRETEIKELQVINDACNEYIDSASNEYRLIIRVSIEDELKAAALDNHIGIIEKMTAYSPSKFSDYFTGSYRYFLLPSKEVEFYMSNYDVFSFDPELGADMKKRGGAHNLVEWKDQNDKKAGVNCMVFTPILGALGFENVAKTHYENMYLYISKLTIRELRKKLDELRENFGG